MRRPNSLPGRRGLLQGSLLLAALPFLLAAPAAAQTSRMPGATPVEEGRRLYVTKGCYQCHGLVGQGAIFGVGPALAPLNLSPQMFRAYVRNPTGPMPPYSARLLPDPEVDAIAAFLGSLPKARPAAEIPLLAPFVKGKNAAPTAPPSAGSALRAPASGVGAAIYRDFCAACHGSDLQGASAAALRSPGWTAERVAELVRRPPPRMPAIYPGTLSERQVTAVAAFVAAAGVKR